MSLRPIDMTITVQRAPEINRSQTGESVRPDVAHQQFADKLDKEVKQQEQTVMQSNKSEEGKIDRDGRGNSGGSGSDKKKREKKDEKQKGSARNGGSMFDISI